MNDISSLFDMGNARLASGDLAGAADAFRQLLARDPACAEAHANLALVLERAGGPAEEIESHYLEALALKPWIADTHLNYGAFLHGRKRLEEAEHLYRHALVLAPDSAQAWSNLAALHACQHRDGEAEQCCRQALAIAPDHASARFNLAYLQLRQGRWEEGWTNFESRDWYAGWAAHLQFPRWQGESLAGKRLLIVCDAGHGDMIQFCRYVPRLKARGAAEITLICQPALAQLLTTLDGLDHILCEVPPADVTWDYWVPAMSLPFHHGTRFDTLPATLPYLHADPARIARWSSRLTQGGLRVGLVWKGNPQFENDDQRSLPNLSVLAPLASVPGIHLFSLQKGAGEDEALAPPPGMEILALGHELNDFADLAAILAQLDLLVSVDTAAAHAAGALGRPCWLLLPDYKTDWRWLADRDDSPWYPGALRLFRQQRMGDWNEVIARIKAALVCARTQAA